jgi:hypothetical protein
MSSSSSSSLADAAAAVVENPATVAPMEDPIPESMRGRHPFIVYCYELNHDVRKDLTRRRVFRFMRDDTKELHLKQSNLNAKTHVLDKSVLQRIMHRFPDLVSFGYPLVCVPRDWAIDHKNLRELTLYLPSQSTSRLVQAKINFPRITELCLRKSGGYRVPTFRGLKGRLDNLRRLHLTDVHFQGTATMPPKVETIVVNGPTWSLEFPTPIKSIAKVIMNEVNIYGPKYLEDVHKGLPNAKIELHKCCLCCGKKRSTYPPYVEFYDCTDEQR